MSTNTQRTTAGLVGDFLAGLPACQSVIVRKLAQHLQRDRGGVKDAINQLAKAMAITTKADPEDLRRTIAFMTAEQRSAWLADAGAAIALSAGINLDVLPMAAKAAVATQQAAERRRQPIRFGIWNDGAISIQGLGRKQLTLPAVDAVALAQLFSSFPEGALKALCDSPLKPAFTLHIDGGEYLMTSEQTAELVAYIEDLPARAIRPAHRPDNRSHRMETPEDREP